MSDIEKQWYVVNTYAGHENRVKENLEKRVESMGLEDNLFRILVAEVLEVEVKANGKEVEKMKNLFPGYLFVEMIMTDEAWYIVRNTPGVTGFIGSSGGGAKPFPVSDIEMDAILSRIGERKRVIDFKVGDMVRITNGPFANNEGKVVELRESEEVAVIYTTMFNQPIKTEVSYSDCLKVN
jgi:transcription termination/antitermination protein NusG